MSDVAQVRAILFDLDGTLIDTVPQLYYAVQAALQSVSQPDVTLEQVRGWIGNGADILLKRALVRNSFYDENQIDESIFTAAKKAFNEHYHTGITANYLLYPQVKETLHMLYQAGYEMAVVTNKPDEFVQPLLQSAEIAQYFSVTLGGGILPVRKPDPTPLLYICDELDIQPFQALMVGDSTNDIQAAKAAGIPVVGFTYGYNHGEPIEDSSPDWVFSHFNELASLMNIQNKRM